MLSEDRFFQTDNTEEIWRRYCGFLDLSLTEFMETQRHLLMEQVKLVANSPLGKALMKGRKPGSVEEFRQTVPLTTASHRSFEQAATMRDEIKATKEKLAALATN